MTVGTYTHTSEADIEDMLGADLYCHIVNVAYGLKDTLKVSPLGCGRIINHIEAQMRMMPSRIQEFDHYGPAEFLARNPQILDGAPGVEDAESRFEAFFKDHAPFIIK